MKGRSTNIIMGITNILYCILSIVLLIFIKNTDGEYGLIFLFVPYLSLLQMQMAITWAVKIFLGITSIIMSIKNRNNKIIIFDSSGCIVYSV